MLDYTDLSLKDFRFNPHLGTSTRDHLRDLADSLLRRPLYKLIYSKKFAHLPYPIDLVLPEKGMSTLARRQWVNKHVTLKNSRILVIGCGDGWDFGSYLRFQPKEIIGIDLYNFSNSWQQIQDYVEQKDLPTKVSFHQLDIAELNRAEFGEFDVICSDAVFEHCQDLKSVLKALYTLLEPQGIIYASYGPLWYSWGGDHFSGRGGIEKGYNHLLLEPRTYQEYYYNNLRDDAFEVQNGGRYIELDLFSKLSTQEYIDLYKQVGFKLESLIIEFSQQAEALQSTPIFKRILERHSQLIVDDFKIKSHILLLRKGEVH
ncbi:MAG: class I SAM-dependent methyltransferase [Scytonematopsis contorta HA4267-MV1]|jgi:SAM-dependent methyltransferase|nr:class I SAM-dependent methyltransferase [Scytonematopsis contorta HA4267-MV1]